MTCFYIKEASEQNKIKLKIKYIFNKLEIKENIIELPIRAESKIKNNKNKKIVKKIKENNVKITVLSNELVKYEQFKNELYSNNINILDGKFLFKVLSKDILECICKKIKLDVNSLEIAVLVNDENDLNKSIIIDLAKEVKSLNIITNNIKDFKQIEELLYDEEGIVMKISNNKKKGLIKSKVIFNLDFCEEDINSYSVPENCIIVNTFNPIKIKTKKFNGINVKDFNIIIPEKYKMQGFSDEVVYESIIYNLDYTEVREKILEDKIRIKDIIGENGEIQEGELNKLLFVE